MNGRQRGTGSGLIECRISDAQKLVAHVVGHLQGILAFALDGGVLAIAIHLQVDAAVKAAPAASATAVLDRVALPAVVLSDDPLEQRV